MIFGVAPSIVLLFAASIFAAPTTLPLSSVVTPSTSTSLPSPNYRQSFNHPLSLAIAIRSAPEPSQTNPHNQDNFRSTTAQRNMLIALSTIGGSITLGFLVAIIRCICRYKHPPKRDRVAEAIERYSLQCEMEELARNPYALRPSHREPAPPYIRPPSYSGPLHLEGTARSDSILLPNPPSSSGFPITLS